MAPRPLTLEQSRASARARLYLRRYIVPGGCWEWTGPTYPNGYGRISFCSYPETVHRVSWIVHVGAISEGQCVLHSCDNRPCFNPKHLFLGTHQDNHDDKIAKGRMRHGHRCGEANSGAKLTWQNVEEIRRRCDAGETTYKLAEELGVSQALVWNVWHGKAWRYATETVVMTNRSLD